MNINIFLKQFRKTNEQIIDLIRKCDSRSFGVEKLRGLLKIMPQQDEVMSYAGMLKIMPQQDEVMSYAGMLKIMPQQDEVMSYAGMLKIMLSKMR